MDLYLDCVARRSYGLGPTISKGLHISGNRFATQATKGAGEDDAVVVLVERAAPQFFRAVQGFAKAFAGKQGGPIQGGYSPYGE